MKRKIKPVAGIFAGGVIVPIALFFPARIKHRFNWASNGKGKRNRV